MKKNAAGLLCACMALCLLGCNKAPDANTTTTATVTTAPPTTQTTPAATENTQPDASAVYEAPMAAVSLPLISETELEEDTVISVYTYQDISVTLPDADVAEAITLALLNKIDGTRALANQVHAAAKADYSGQDNWYPYSYTILYSPMRLDQNILSFYGTEASFDGSPRSVLASVSVNFDLTTGESLALRTIFHEENFADALCELIVEGLSGYAENELFSDYQDIIRSKFSTNVPVENWYFSDKGLCFYFAPYEIAAYATGTVVSEIPYESLSGLLKDEYFPAENLSYSGAVQAEVITPSEDSRLTDYSQFAEVTVDSDAQQLLITVDGSVSNVRLHYSTDVSEATILGLAGMGPTDAVLLKISPEDAVDKLTISFDSFGQTQTLSLQQNPDGTLTFTK